MVLTKRYPNRSLVDEKGAALLVCLLLVIVLIILGTTAMLTSTTDLRISADYKVSRQAFYVAETGIEEARTRLRVNAPSPITDSSPTSSGWSAFIGVADKAQEHGYNSGNSLHSLVSALQPSQDYTVRVQHKTNAGGQILYWGDSNGDAINERNTSAGENIYRATSYGAASGGKKTIDVELTRVPPITTPAALYVEATTKIQGTSTNVIGIDQCGGANVPGIATTLTTDTVKKAGNPIVSGSTSSTWSVVGNVTNMDVQAIIDNFKGLANYSYNVNSATITGMSWGTPVPGATQQNPSTCSVSNIVYYNTNDTDVKLAGGTTGCGLLLVEGDLELQGGFQWYGLVILSGSVLFTGGGNKQLTGALIAGGSADADVVGGDSNIVHCSSAINDQTKYLPLRRLSWREGNI
jgi:Tfp pilus assembly protein PilX